MWSLGRYTLRLTEYDFWRCSAVQIMALIERYEQEQDFQYYNTGIVASSLYNIAIAKAGKKDSHSKPLAPEDFVPRMAEKKAFEAEEDKIVILTVEQTIAEVAKLNQMLGGFDARFLKQRTVQTEPEEE